MVNSEWTLKCPLCGGILVHKKDGGWVCQNPRCAIIEVRIRRTGVYTNEKDDIKSKMGVNEK